MFDDNFEFDDNRDSTDNCANDGPACLGCPCFDFCSSHEDTTD